MQNDERGEWSRSSIHMSVAQSRGYLAIGPTVAFWWNQTNTGWSSTGEALTMPAEMGGINLTLCSKALEQGLAWHQVVVQVTQPPGSCTVHAAAAMQMSPFKPNEISLPLHIKAVDQVVINQEKHFVLPSLNLTGPPALVTHLPDHGTAGSTETCLSVGIERSVREIKACGISTT